MICLASSVAGCTTQRLVHYSMGTLRVDQVERVEAAWASTNEVPVAVVGFPANARKPGPYTLVYRLSRETPGTPPPIWDLQFQARKGILPGFVEPQPDQFFPLKITRVDQRLVEFHPATHFYILEQSPGGTDYLFTPGACLGVRVYAAASGSSREDWASRLWHGFDPVYHKRWWSMPAIPICFAFDAAVYCVFNIPDLLAGLGNSTLHPSGDKRWAKWMENNVGVNWRDELTPPRPY
jgi:hypothetical protein